MVGRLIVALILLVAAALLPRTGTAQPRPEIWFTPMQQSRNLTGHGITFDKYDFSQMVTSDTGWQTAAGRISVMDINAVGIAAAYPHPESVISMIKRHRFRILAAGSVVYTNRECEVHSEGITNDLGFEREFVLQMHRWKILGGHVDYIAMDSPLVFGYFLAQKHCHFSIEEVARRAATTINLILQDFPDARIVDAEGLARLSPTEWFPKFEIFTRAFDAVSRRPIEFLALDMRWTDDWHTGYSWTRATRQLATYGHSIGLKVGLIINADAKRAQNADGSMITTQPMTNSLWMEIVRSHIHLVHSEKLPLDFISINSWVRFPFRNLPETDPDAFMSLVNYAYDLWSK